ncbi:reverse transcriptase domain-containing protein [Tanacetum coccineum]|uniref:Reverse transcriptase domain-containing protein n=1 Tax=Tanacetum coccineum TaxID=301880 RepID=A0ABQ5HD02_9ASTR
MADNRTMAQMLQAPIEGYEDAIVVPPINANNLISRLNTFNQSWQSNSFAGRRSPEIDRQRNLQDTILTWTTLVSKFINQFFPPSKTTYLRNKITNFFQEPDETFNEAWECFKGLIVNVHPRPLAFRLHQLDTFYNSLNSNDQDALDSAAGGNFLDKMPQEGLAIIESKSKVRYSRSRANDSRVSTDAPLSTSSPSNNSFEIQQMAALLEDKMNIRMSRLEKAISEKNATTPATVKAVEEVCVTCGSNHNFNNCPLTRNDFPVFQDNIHQFQQTAAVGNFLQRNQPSNLANQMRPPGFNQPNVQNNQNRYQGTNSNFNQNRGTNFNQNRQNNQNQVYQAPPYQPPTNQPLVNQALPPVSQIQGVSKTDFESYAKANDANMNNLQMKLDNFQRNQNDFQRSYNDSQKKQDDFQNLMLGFMQNYHNNSTASTSRSGTLPSQTVTNPRQQINAITTRSGKTLEEPSTPLVPTPDVSIPSKEPEQNPETSTEKVQNPNLENTAHVPPPGEEDSIFIEIPKPKAKKTVNVEIQDLNSPRPNSYPSKLPYPERMKVRENDKPSAQHSRFLKMFKQLRLEIGLKDALVEMPKFNKWLSSLLRNKEKLEEIAITTVNAECSAIIMNKVPEKLEDPGKFLIPCALQELNRTSALADSGASINLLPHSIYKKLELRALDSYRREHSTCQSRRIADELAPLDSLPPGNDDSTLKKDFHEVNFQVYSNPLFEFDDNFKSSNVNPLFEENDKDAEIKSSSSFTLTSPEESEFEAYLEKDSIPPGIDLTLPPTLEVSSSNPTSPTLTGEKVCSWKTSMFFSLVRFVWKMMTRIAIRKKIICLLATYLHKKPKLLSHPQEIEEIKDQEDEVSSEIPIDTIVMPIRITFDNPIDFNDHFSKPKDFKKDLTVSFDSSESSILPSPLLDSDSPFTAELSASVTLNSLRNEDKVFKPGTDKTKITRKPSKTGKHGHENGRVNKSRKQSQEKVKLQSKGSQTQSNPVNNGQTWSNTK